MSIQANRVDAQISRRIDLQSALREKWRSIKYRAGKNKIAYAFVAPYLLIFTVFTILPVVISLFYSLTYYNMLEPAKWVGLQNYARLLLSDQNFLTAVKNTFIFALVTGPIGYMISLLTAWLINELSSKARAVIVLLFYAPSISGNVYMIWKIMFSGDAYGYINSVLMSLGIITSPVQWLQDPKYILAIIILVTIWMSLGTSFLAFIAGLQGIDRSLYESGAIDGIKNRWQELWYITLPSMKPQLMFGAVLSITSAFAVADVSINMAGFPSVQYAGHTIVTHLMDYGNIRFEMGYASAIATVLFVVMVTCNKFVNKFLRRVGT